MKFLLIILCLALLSACSDDHYVDADNIDSFSAYSGYAVTTDAETVELEYFSQDRFKKVKINK